ncbi:unnamed protein product, partial [Meganyctiphanes norvegica]
MSLRLFVLELRRLFVPEIRRERTSTLVKNITGKRKDINVGEEHHKKGHQLFGMLYLKGKGINVGMTSSTGQGYKSIKAKLGVKRVRPWKWMAFVNPARKDGFKFYHWRRICDERKDYPFAKFNKESDIMKYSDSEYSEHLVAESWTRDETDALFELCRRFDLRWPVIHDRWPSHLTTRPLEDIKERYYNVTNHLKKVHNLSGPEGKIIHYDAEHERRRKQQLIRLWERTPKQVEEEHQLLAELRKIEARKKEREKKTQDLQKLIQAADGPTNDLQQLRKVKHNKKKMQHHKITKTDQPPPTLESCTGIKFPDVKASGVSLRSSRMKLPASVGQKKVKAIEQLLQELGLGN